MARFRWTTLSFANARTDLPGDPAPIRTPFRLGRLFERESDPRKEAEHADQRLSESERRAKAMAEQQPTATQQTQGRSSTMVANDRPQPVLKPLLELAREVDRSSFDARWEEERRSAIVRDLKQDRERLLGLRKTWDQTEARVDATIPRAVMGDPDGAAREATQAYQETTTEHEATFARSRQVLERSKRPLKSRSRLSTKRRKTVTDQRNDQNGQDTTAKPGPADTLRDGSLKATIWRNEGQNGAYHTVNLARTYKDDQGNYQDTGSFRAQDMLGLSELSRQAHYRAHDLNREAFKDQRRTAPEPERASDRAR